MISVIVPIYNTESYLRQCLQSIIDQTYTDLEIICINDGSTDNSLSIMQEFAERDSRIRIIDKKNQGYGATCNRGIDEARGEYIALVEPDDWIEQDMYADMMEYGACFTQAIDIIKTAYWRIKDPDTEDEKKLNCPYKGRIMPPQQPFTLKESPELINHHPSIWSALYHASFLREQEIKFKEIPGAGWADNPFLYETLCQARTIAYLDNAYYCYREDTVEKTQSFARSNTFMPLERWNDQAEVLERLAVSDTGILQAHYRRGFKYLNGITEVVGLSYPGIKEAAVQMLRRMDKSIVYNDTRLKPAYKAFYAQLLNLPKPRLNHFPYLAHFAVDGLYSLKNNGISATFSAAKRFLKRRKEQTKNLGDDT